MLLFSVQQSVLLIQSGASWGTGCLLKINKTKLIITCSHVITAVSLISVPLLMFNVLLVEEDLTDLKVPYTEIYFSCLRCANRYFHPEVVLH